MKTVYFLRRRYTPFGGSEKDFQDLYDALKTDPHFRVEMIHFRQPTWLPGWVNLLFYNLQVCRRKTHEGIYFSSDRLTCLDVHKAGGGTHKSFLKTKGMSLNPLHPTYLWLEKRTLQNAKKIVAVSRLVKEDIIRDYGISPEKIEVVYNGIRVEEIGETEIARRGNRIRKEFGIAPELPVVLFVGSGFRRKGVREFLELLSALRQDFMALVVGKEKRLAHYRALAHSLGLEGKVIFTGPRTDARDFYCASDLFLFPTHYEPFGNVILEAMNYGNVVVTTRQCGAGELLTEEPRMQTPQDKKILPFLEEALCHSEMRRRIARKNREEVNNYGIERNASQMRRIFEELEYGR